MSKMGLTKKDRRYILTNYPAKSVKELAQALSVKTVEVVEVLQASGRNLNEKATPPSNLLGHARASFLGIMVLIAVVSVVFLNSTRNGFHYDDIHSLLQNFGVAIDPSRNPDSLKKYGKYFVNPYMFSSRPGVAMPRPLLMCTFGFNYMLSALWCDHRESAYDSCVKQSEAEKKDTGKECQVYKDLASSCNANRGYDPRGWLLVNILFHLANVIIIYVGLCHLTGRRRLALITALLFTLHPINTETINYINCRSESMSAFFILLSMYFFTRWLRDQKPWMLIVYAVVFVLGLLTKELVFVTIALLLVVDALFVIPSTQGRYSFDRQWMSRAVGYGFTIVAMIAYMIYRKELLKTYIVDQPVRSVMDNLVTQSGVLLTYIRLMFYPIHQNISYENESIIHAWKGLGDPFFGPRFLFFLALAAGGVLDGYFGFVRRRPAVVAFAIFLFFITLSITSLVPLNAIMNEHRLYIVSLGPCLLIASGLTWLANVWREKQGRALNSWPWPVQGLTLLLLAIFASLTVQRNFSWLSDLTVWRNSTWNSPTKAQVVSDLGNAYFRGGGVLIENGDVARDGVVDSEEQRVILQTFHETVPVGEDGKITPETQAAMTRLYLKGLHRAEQLYQWAIRVERDYYKAWHNLGTIHFTYAMLDREQARSIITGYDQGVVGIQDRNTKLNDAQQRMKKAQEDAAAAQTEAAAARQAGDEAKAKELEAKAQDLSRQAADASAEVDKINAEGKALADKLDGLKPEIVKNLEKAEQDLDEAMTYFDGATRISANGESYNDWGSCLTTKADIEVEKARVQGREPDAKKILELNKEALKKYLNGVRYNPKLHKGYVNIAVTLPKTVPNTTEDQRKAREQAIPYLDKAIELNPVDPRPYWLKGSYLYQNGKVDEAVRTFQECLGANKDYGPCMTSLKEIQKGKAGPPGGSTVPPP
jgi:tetratricopeptide (TPR) repeat protein